MNGVICNTIHDVYKEMVECIRVRMHEDSDNAEYYEYLLHLPEDVLLEMFKDTYEEV